jgi:hypothetical protein
VRERQKDRQLYILFSFVILLLPLNGVKGFTLYVMVYFELNLGLQFFTADCDVVLTTALKPDPFYR